MRLSFQLLESFLFLSTENSSINSEDPFPWQLCGHHMYPGHELNVSSWLEIMFWPQAMLEHQFKYYQRHVAWSSWNVTTSECISGNCMLETIPMFNSLRMCRVSSVGQRLWLNIHSFWQVKSFTGREILVQGCEIPRLHTEVTQVPSWMVQ